jgi:mannose-6-phosphate isomerase-like protein (cupin superfamily)
MIVRNISEIKLQSVRAHNGEGIIGFCRLFTEEDFDGPWHFVDFAVVPPGSSIGIHQHGNNEELYFVLSGEGKMSVNGEEYAIRSGDLILNKVGWSHGLRNESGEDISILVVEVGVIS